MKTVLSIKLNTVLYTSKILNRLFIGLINLYPYDIEFIP